MAAYYKILFFLLFIGSFSVQLMSQIDLATFVPKKNVVYEIETSDGGTILGQILNFDLREVHIQSKEQGEMIIPRHQVKRISVPDSISFDAKGNFIPEERFATRYFITTNGLPIKKGEHYALLNWYGPDLEFAVADNFGLGVMTTWIGAPIVGTAKYTIKLGDNLNMAVGGLLGSLSYFSFNTGFALPYASFTLGNRRSNITLTGGYGVVFSNDENSGEFLVSVAGMKKVHPKWNLVFDSFIVPNLGSGGLDGTVALLIPGVRYQGSSRNAFQLGVSLLIVESEFLPVPLPMVQWFTRLN